MCFLPKLNQIKKKTQTIATFRGLNERKSIADGEFSDCCNVSLEEYHAVSVMDGYEQYGDALEATGKIEAKSTQNDMVIWRGSSATWSHLSKESTLHEWLLDDQLPALTVVKDFSMYNGSLVALGQTGTIPYLYILSIESDNTTKYQGTDFATFFGGQIDRQPFLVPFGNRMIIVYKTEIHISFKDNITDYTTFKVEGTPTEECAQVIKSDADGDFTGCVNYRDYPIFFTENSMYMLLGEYAPFSLSRIDAIGCVCSKTIAICNGKLYFLSKLGVMEYDGGTPELISQNINLDVNSASYTQYQYACADNRYYYIGEYIYDTYTKTWSKQKIDGNYVCPQCYFNNQLYAMTYYWTDIPGESSYTVYTLYRKTKDTFSNWYFTTKQFHEYQEGKKIVSKLIIGFEKENTAALKIEVSLNKGTFQTVYTWDGTTDFVKEVPVLLPPCDYFQVRVSGTGKTIVHYIKREFRVLGA